MDRRGGCCIARYAGGAYEQEKNMMERAMLKFRPIAPKPTTGAGSAFGSSSSDNKTSSGDTTYVKATGRGKRKYNNIANKSRKRNSNRGERKRVRASHLENDTSRLSESSGVVTLPLLPESPTNQTNCKTPTSSLPPAPVCWLSFSNSEQIKQAAESVVTVECVSVTDIWIGEGLGRTDEERLRNLEWDMCPGFITDGERRVKWINRAYKNMVRVDDDDDQLVVVRVENMKDDISWPAFTCRVRVQHTSTKEVKILPCDVWRMDCGGLAWRLDVKAALSLGR